MKTFPSPHNNRLPGNFAWLRRFLAGTAFAVLLLSLFSAAGLLQAEAGRQPAPAQSLGASVVISQFRVIGPLGGNDEFIEIFNPTQEDIDISGWQILGSNNNAPPATGVRYTFPSGTSIAKGQYRLIGHSGHGPDVVPDSDITPNTYSTGIVDAGGIALRTNNGVIVDQVGMGINSAYKEGTHLPPLTGNNNRSYIRNPYGQGACFDYNDNSIDFQEITPSQPRNSSSPFTTCPAPTPTPEWQRMILINEVAWGGTRADDILAQWIELHNPGSIDVDLTGWYLRIPGKGDILLNGTIIAGGYYLLERNQSDTDVPADLVYAFPFLDTNGDRLFLYSNAHNLVDSANSNGGPWPAGNRFGNYASMERRSNEPDTDAAWLTFDRDTYTGPIAADRLGNNIYGSPGQPNSPGLVSTPTPTPTFTFTPTLTPTPTLTLTPTITLTPSANMSIIISEVAWMGTAASSGDEWIELYNPGLVDVSLAGWTIRDRNNTVLFTFSNCTEPPQPLSNCIIRAQDFLVLVRNVGSIKDASGEFLEDQRFTFQMTNNPTGGTLRLFPPGASRPVDTANNNGGAWPAGRSTHSNPSEAYCTMERRSLTIQDTDPTAWLTFAGDSTRRLEKDRDGNPICGSPGRRNWALSVTPTPPPVGPTRIPIATRVPTSIPPARISQVIINEFLPFPGSDWNSDGKVDFGDEFIELMNVGNVAVNLQGWRLDDQAGDSSPYTIGAISLAPGARVVFFASETGILLSNRSDSVRVFQPNGAISDAFTYTTVPKRDQSWCRLPDGSMDWTFGCEPTPGLLNKLAETVFRGERDLPVICQSPLLPAAIYLAECQASGQDVWSRRLWDGLLPVFQVFFERQAQEHWFE